METKKSHVRIKLDDRIIKAEAEQTLLEALVAAGLLLRNDCGGKGRCGKCVVSLLSADRKAVSPPDESETALLGADRIRQGERLACRTRVLTDVALEIPPGSFLSAEVGRKGPPILFEKLEGIAPPPGRPATEWGLAVDLGTTTIALYLCNIACGDVAASVSVKNPQAIFGDDVMTRIGAVSLNPSLLGRVQKMAVTAIDWGAAHLCRAAGIDAATIRRAMVVGNSTMIHLLLGEDPRSIGVYPYMPRFSDAQKRRADAIGLQFNPSAEVQTLPLITGFIGSDIVGAALAAGLSGSRPGTMLVDVGTNGEIMMLGESGLAATSCATGPAFEGATIRHGMQALSGAIDAVHLNPKSGSVHCSVIQRNSNRPAAPSGLCGTGVISAIAALLRNRIITPSGAFNPDSRFRGLRQDSAGVPEFVLVKAADAGNGRDITLTQADVRAVQLAKGALRTGIDLLSRENAIVQPQRLLVAGAFGSFIDTSDALSIGMFPDIGKENIQSVGNAAGAGAILALLDERVRQRATEICHRTQVLDLASHPDFQNTFVAALSFPEC